MRSVPLLALVLPLALGGCLAKTAVNVATAPVRVVGKGVHMATSGHAKADQKRGRELRKREQKLGMLEREYDRENKDCVKGSDKACEAARWTYNQIQVLLPTVPVEPRR